MVLIIRFGERPFKVKMLALLFNENFFLKTQEALVDFFTTGKLAVSLLKFLIKPFSPRTISIVKKFQLPSWCGARCLPGWHCSWLGHAETRLLLHSHQLAHSSLQPALVLWRSRGWSSHCPPAACWALPLHSQHPPSAPGRLRSMRLLGYLQTNKNVFPHCYTNRETVLSLKNVLWLRDNFTHQSIDKRWPVRSGSLKSCDIPCLHLQHQVNYL